MCAVAIKKIVKSQCKILPNVNTSGIYLLKWNHTLFFIMVKNKYSGVKYINLKMWVKDLFV